MIANMVQFYVEVQDRLDELGILGAAENARQRGAVGGLAGGVAAAGLGHVPDRGRGLSGFVRVGGRRKGAGRAAGG